MPVRLGELLLKENMVSPQQLQDALNQQKQNGGRLSKALVSLGFVKDEEIASLLSRQYGVPSLDLDLFEVDPEIIKIIPADTARLYQALPLSRSKKKLTVAFADPTNVLAIDDINFMTGYNVVPVVASESALEAAIEKYYPPRPLGLRRHGAPDDGSGARGSPAFLNGAADGPTLSVEDMAAIGGLSEIDLDALAATYAEEPQDKEVDLGHLAKSADAAPVIKITNVLLADSLRLGASHIHIEPYEREFRVRFRIDAILYSVMVLPVKLREPLISRIKFLAKIKAGDKRLPQSGRIKVSFRVEDRSRDVDFLVSCLPTGWGDKIVMRLRDKSTLLLDMTKLGFEPHSLEGLRNALSRSRGLVLLTGPPRSGKTTTLYSVMAALDEPGVNIMTAEDPIEFALPGVNQVQISEDVGAGFPAVLRSFPRLDSNVIAIGATPDAETAGIAVTLALDGYRVFSILEGDDAPSTVSRMVNMGIEPFLVGTAVNLIQAQRLVRRICAKCKVDDTANMLSKTLADIGFTPEQIGSFQVMKGKGCATCNGTGYKGRVGLYEVMEITEGIRDLIMVGATAVEIRRKALEEGMLTLRMSGLEKIKNGVTTVDEVLRETDL